MISTLYMNYLVKHVQFPLVRLAMEQTKQIPYPILPLKFGSLIWSYTSNSKNWLKVLNNWESECGVLRRRRTMGTYWRIYELIKMFESFDVLGDFNNIEFTPEKFAKEFCETDGNSVADYHDVNLEYKVGIYY